MATISTILAELGSGQVVTLNPTRSSLLLRCAGMGIAENTRILRDGIGELIENNLMYKWGQYGVTYLDGLFVYLYLDNTSTDGLNESKTLPTFINKDLTIDLTKVTAIFSNQTVVDTGAIKNGVLVDRAGDMLNKSSDSSYFVSGLSYYAAPGYGTGQFNCICLSTMDLSKLDINMQNNGKLIYGRNVANINGYHNGYIGDGKTPIPALGLAESEILVAAPSNAWYKKNLSTGAITKVDTPTIPYTAGATICNQYVINNKLYYLAYTGTSYGYNYYHFIEYDISTGVSRAGASDKYDGYDLVKVGEELYVHARGTDVMKKMDLSTLEETATIITLSEVVQSVRNYQGNYMCTRLTKGPSFIFTSLTDIAGTITGVKFISDAIEIIDASAKAHYLLDWWNTDSSNQNTYYNAIDNKYKFIEVDPDVTPLLGYYKDTIVSEKRAADEMNVNIYDVVANG